MRTNKQIQFINRKMVISGKVLELYNYEKPFAVGGTANKNGRANQNETDERTKEENRKKTAQRARTTVRRMANANAKNLTKFLTLTFAENITDIKYARNLFDKFLKRLKYKYHDLEFQYISVIEFQKRGAVHFHLLCNLPFTDSNDIAKIWKHGFIKINKIDNVDNVGAYITKYMTKDNIDDRLKGKKCYTMSKNLALPKESTDDQYINDLMSELEGVKRQFVIEYDTEYFGKVQYIQIICDKPIKTVWLDELDDYEPCPFDV